MYRKFVVKLLLNGILTIPLLMWFCEAGFIEAAVISVLLSAVAYMVGDRMLLSVSNNTIATIGDFTLAFIFLWATAQVMGWINLSFGEIFIISLAVAVVEIWFHSYLHRRERARA